MILLVNSMIKPWFLLPHFSLVFVSLSQALSYASILLGLQSLYVPMYRTLICRPRFCCGVALDSIKNGVAVEPKVEEETGLELNENNIEKFLQEIPANIVGEPSESLELLAIEEPIGKIQFTGPVAAVTTVVVLSHGNYGRKYHPLQQFTFYSTQTFMFSLGSFMIKEGCVREDILS
ncbi:hypothetical protein RHGRI_030480 [Rhododendron griersonianum]|uniref:Uncharacterized protein n=1 Tax=Rhododendron griersonianum TaxID=479676 RepID=A0AAV6ISB4_9ERIC|nr:hypothetical protein RHGRI_030480 [Rhododendron griersonianum]